MLQPKGLCLPLLVLVCLIAQSSSLGFRNGRHMNGFLGQPSSMPTLQRSLDVEDLWFEQRLNHFKPDDTRTWQQRYFVNDAFYRNDSQAPVFLMIGGEGEATKSWMREGAWIHYAEHFGALCIQLEHRFYGKSHPTSDLSNSNLAYLSSEQALADLANFVSAMKRQYNMADSQKWIAFGGSYPGSLAAWAREKYPHLIDGAISSSGPLLAQVDFNQYFEVVKASLASYKPECVEAVSRGFAQVEILLKHMIGQRNLDEKFKYETNRYIILYMYIFFILLLERARPSKTQLRISWTLRICLRTLLAILLAWCSTTRTIARMPR